MELAIIQKLLQITMKNANYCFTWWVLSKTQDKIHLNYDSKHGTTQTHYSTNYFLGGHKGGTLDFAEYCVSIQGDLA